MIGPVRPSPAPAERLPLPDTRDAVTFRIQVGETHGYLIVGLYPDGKPGEIFVHGFSPNGETLQGCLDALAISVSMGLQCGVSLDWYVAKLQYLRFPPFGRLGDRGADGAYTSIVDAVFHVLEARFCNTKKEGTET